LLPDVARWRGPDSYDAQNSAKPSENTHRLSDFRGKILKLAFELRNQGYSEAYLKTLIRALNLIASKTELENIRSVLARMCVPKFSLLQTVR